MQNSKLENWYSIRDSGTVFSIGAQIFRCIGRMAMKVISMESPHPGGPSKYPPLMNITHRKFFRAIWSQKTPKKCQEGQKSSIFSLILKHLLNLLDAQIFFSVDFLNTCLLSFESPGPGELVTYLCRACETSRNFFDGLKSLTMFFQAKRSKIVHI